MANKIRVNVHLTVKQIDNVLNTFGVSDLIERYMTDPRVRKTYDELHDLFNAQYPDTMACVNEHVKSEFYKDFDKFVDSIKAYFKRTLAELALEEFASTAGNIALTTKHIRAKAPMFFTQRFHVIYEEMSFNIRLDKVLNGQQTIDWM